MTMQVKDNRNPAEKALFQFEFYAFMLSCGRDEEAAQAYTNCHAILKELSEAMRDEQAKEQRSET